MSEKYESLNSSLNIRIKTSKNRRAPDPSDSILLHSFRANRGFFMEMDLARFGAKLALWRGQPLWLFRISIKLITFVFQRTGFHKNYHL
jgi:hypothetical protein